LYVFRFCFLLPLLVHTSCQVDLVRGSVVGKAVLCLARIPISLKSGYLVSFSPPRLQ
jgi:hypothetical protein